ncbi:MAG: hypothetical protein ACE361_16570 [Aureliella sp.]
MAGRAATAVKSKAATKTRATAAKKTVATKKVKAEAGSESVEATAVAEKPTRTRRKVKAETRTRIYWAVFNQALKRVAVFEFDQKAEAEKRAEKLQKSSGEDHFIQKIKATVSV